MTTVIITLITMLLALLSQTPMVQTYIANKVLKTLSENINGKVYVERIHFMPFSNLVLKNVIIIDEKPVLDEAD
jgi:hypothetical protein